MSKTLVKSEETSKKWSIRKESILEDLKIPFSKFILAVKLFILKVPAHKAHKELDLAYSLYTNLSQKITSFYQDR